jgi:hypothetical protein
MRDGKDLDKVIGKVLGMKQDAPSSFIELDGRSDIEQISAEVVKPLGLGEITSRQTEIAFHETDMPVADKITKKCP